MKKMIWMFLVLGSLAVFTTCKKDDDTTTNDPLGRYHLLYKKMWYNQNQSRGDHYFTPNDSTTGTFTVDHPFMPDYSGTYQWYPSGDSMMVDISGTILSYKFKKIEEHFMSYAPSNEPENVYTFQDTKP
ncbi:MAG TPA: hypothetical protein P5228_11245 [Bacteroidales bacterium]|nr:hypothetical protein [Bacteroidales bacterium]HRZ48680.1 hypothetical protein [Bacteroidales bacterium]